MLGLKHKQFLSLVHELKIRRQRVVIQFQTNIVLQKPKFKKLFVNLFFKS